MKETWFVTGSSVGMGRSIAEAALAEGHDVVASARCAGGTDCKERYHEIDRCRTSCSGHGIDRGAAHQPLFQSHAGQHRRRDQHRLSRTFIGLAMYVPAEVTARTSADFLIPGD
jgi:NAD(P)-dependent dehydrogenase (short-subunit alcohol dehydrogenase family)